MPEWELLTVRELADHLQLNQQTVRNWINAGELQSVKLGRAVRIPRQAAVTLAGGDGWEMPQLMTVEQVADFLRVDKQTVYNWIDAGILEAFSLGERRVRIKKSVLKELIDASLIGAPPPELAPTQSAEDFWLGTEEVGELVFAPEISPPSRSDPKSD
jgi:excisionase family DNA binding protein